MAFFLRFQGLDVAEVGDYGYPGGLVWSTRMR